MDLLDRLEGLKSIWGALSCTSVLFPGATYFFNIGSTKTSPLGEFFLATGVPLGALAVLLALVTGHDRKASKARNYMMVGAIVLALLSLMGFVLMASERQDSVSFKGPGTCSFYFGGNQGDGYHTQITIAGGWITEVKTPCECEHSGPMQWSDCKNTGPEVVTRRAHPDEFWALGFFDTSVIGLAAAFAMLSHEVQVRKKLAATPANPTG
jgi:hypothetical protein